MVPEVWSSPAQLSPHDVDLRHEGLLGLLPLGGAAKRFSLLQRVLDRVQRVRAGAVAGGVLERRRALFRDLLRPPPARLAQVAVVPSLVGTVAMVPGGLRWLQDLQEDHRNDQLHHWPCYINLIDHVRRY